MTINNVGVEENTANSTINYVNIQSLIEAHLFYTGQATQRQYEWRSAGVIVGVDEKDVPELLSKRLGGKLCCGSGNDNRIFQIVGG